MDFLFEGVVIGIISAQQTAWVVWKRIIRDPSVTHVFMKEGDQAWHALDVADSL